MKDYKRYGTVNNGWVRGPVVKRIVNQEEIVNYFRHNPGKTESQMQRDVYQYYRGSSFDSNKKYADCLRRALAKGTISRVLGKNGDSNRKVYLYFAV